MILGLLKIVGRSLRQHVLSTVVTVLSAALAAGLVMAVFSIKQQTHAAFVGGPAGFDAVLGARGSQLQLILNSVFHLETSPGNIPWAMYREIAEDPRVDLAIPYAVGDNYQGYRLVGTTEELFTRFEYRKGVRFECTEGGRFFDPALREAVIGSVVAEKTGLKVGSTLNPYHGLVYDPKMKHAEKYVVTGVLKPTNSPSDRVIWIPIEGIFRMGGHVLRGTGTEFKPEAGSEIPDEHKEVSAVMLKFRSPMAGFQFDQMINRQGKAATLAWPISKVMAEYFDKMGWVDRVLALVAYLVVLVSAGSILASIYNSMNERRRDFAILRALGAKRRVIFTTIVTEAALIAGLGGILGWVVQMGILAGAAVVIRDQTGVVLELTQWHPALAIAPAGMLVLGAIVGIVPAYNAYRTDVAENLSPVS